MGILKTNSDAMEGIFRLTTEGGVTKEGPRLAISHILNGRSLFINRATGLL